MNLPTIIGACIVAAIVLSILRSEIKKKKEGKGGCSCGCGDCANAGICHPHTVSEK